MKQSQKIVLILIFLTIWILSPVAYGQLRDPFSLPSGIRLLSIASVAKGAPSTDISPPSLKVNAILIGDHIRLASIDRHIVTVGDSIHDEKILEIKNDRVILGKGDKKRTILLSQSPVQVRVEER